MNAPLNLIKNDLETEKRVLPRFPLVMMTFKADQVDEHVFEVRDISFSGMQIGLKNGNHRMSKGDKVSGTLIWNGRKLKLLGYVKWLIGSRLGVLFDTTNGLGSEINAFLSVNHLAEAMRPLHLGSFDIELPVNLKYWLKSDGPAEIFVWQHRDGELSRFQFMIMDKLIEWHDGSGIKTGKIMQLRDLETPLQFQGEFDFNIDQSPDKQMLLMAKEIVALIPDSTLPQGAAEFLTLKLGF